MKLVLWNLEATAVEVVVTEAETTAEVEVGVTVAIAAGNFTSFDLKEKAPREWRFFFCVYPHDKDMYDLKNRFLIHNVCMKWTLLVGWGIVIYAIVYLAWSTLVIHGIIDGLLPRFLLSAVLLSVVYFATMSLPKKKKWRDILPYSIGWLGIALIFDLACAVPVSGWDIWHDWGIWIGYNIVVGLPLLFPKIRHHTKARKPSL